jgi:hypothetical protein
MAKPFPLAVIHMTEFWTGSSADSLSSSQSGNYTTAVSLQTQHTSTTLPSASLPSIHIGQSIHGHDGKEWKVTWHVASQLAICLT